MSGDRGDADSRPRARPQYGEYASPEEQRAAIKQPAEWQVESDQTGAPPQDLPAPGAYQPGADRPTRPRLDDFSSPSPYERRPVPAQPARSGVGDRLATFLLLAYGLYNVVEMIANAAQGGALVQKSAQAIDAADGQLLGGLPGWVWTATAIAYSVVWLVALLSSMRAMRAGRIAFWIPLVAGVVASLLVVALVVIAVGENPALLHSVPTPSGTGGTGGTGSPT